MLKPLSVDRQGPFLALEDGGLATIDDAGWRISRDDGVTWSSPTPVCPGVPRLNGEPACHYLLRTPHGVIVLIYLNMQTRDFRWDPVRREPLPGCRGEIWAIRSLDGGRSWTDHQCLLGGYNANFFGFIRTGSGRLVASVPHLVMNPGRWVTGSIYSDDEGKTWARSHWIDLGGWGHHDGALEPALVELTDGRLLMLIRTNLGRFWQAFSDDNGCTWRTLQASAIEASSAPGAMIRLGSGRILLVWNRLGPAEGGRPYGTASDRNDGQHTEFPASWFREELSMAVSEDEARSWSSPVMLARQPGELCYPYLFERCPGEIWITAGITWLGPWGGAKAAPFRVKIDERDIPRM